MEETITYHICSKCGEEKPLTSEFFCRRKINKSGFMGQCKECNRKRCNDYTSKNKSKISRNYKIWSSNNREKKLKYFINWRIGNPQKQKEYYQKHKEKLYNDDLYKMITHLRKILLTSFKKNEWSKNTKTQDYLDCDWETFKKHIENQFTEGMSWENQGEWHYDHYYPISLAETEEDMYIFNHYTNFQPLWAKDNLSKSNKVPDGFEEWYEMMKEKLSQ